MLISALKADTLLGTKSPREAPRAEDQKEESKGQRKEGTPKILGSPSAHMGPSAINLASEKCAQSTGIQTGIMISAGGAAAAPSPGPKGPGKGKKDKGKKGGAKPPGNVGNVGCPRKSTQIRNGVNRQRELNKEMCWVSSRLFGNPGSFKSGI